MSYKKSRARRAFEKSVEDILARLRLAQRLRLEPRLAEYVMASAVFLGHAEMENYVADIFAGFAQVSTVVARSCDDLPENLRAHLFVRRSNIKPVVAKAFVGGAEKDFLKAMALSLNGASRGFVDPARPLGSIYGGDVIGESKYPSKDNLKAVFNRIGVPDLFDSLGSILKEDCTLLLESIGSLRTQLAHNATMPGAGYKDIKDVLLKTSRFVGGLDRVVYKVTVKYFKKTSWSTELC